MDQRVAAQTSVVAAPRSIGRLTISQIEAGPGLADWAPPGDEGDCLLLVLQHSGRCVLWQEERAAALRPGDLALCAGQHRYCINVHDISVHTVLSLPTASLRGLCPGAAGVSLQRLDGQVPQVALLAAAVRAGGAVPFETLPAVCGQHAERALLELLALAFNAEPAQRAVSGSRLAQFHVNRIRQYVLAHLGDAELSVQQVARALSLSASHIHRLFEAQEQTFSAWLWECRLQACKQALRQPGNAGLSISQVAYQYGFSHAAHFSRAFKERFGLTARQWRAR